MALRIFYNWTTSHINIFHNWLDALLFYIVADEIAYWVAWIGVKIFKRRTGSNDYKLNSTLHWSIRLVIYVILAILTLIAIALIWLFTEAPKWLLFIFLGLFFIGFVQLISFIKIWSSNDNTGRDKEKTKNMIVI